MAFEALVLTVLIASPSDTRAARDSVEGAILAWNRDRARNQRAVLLPLRWESDAIPQLGSDAQSIINEQLVDDADIVIGLFHSRLGHATQRATSGTAEEIEKSRRRGAKVHIYFSEMPHPSDVDTKQLAALREYQEELKAQGYLGSYVSHEDLVARVRTALEHDVDELAGLTGNERASEGTPQPRVILRARYESDREPHVDSKGRTSMRTRRQRLVVDNLGTAPAEGVTISIEPVGQGRAPEIIGDSSAERVPPQASVSFLLSVTLGVASQWRVTFEWQEDGKGFQETQTVTGL